MHEEHYDVFSRGKENVNPQIQRTHRKTFTDIFSKDVDDVFPEYLPKSESSSPQASLDPDQETRAGLSATAVTLQNTLIKWIRLTIINSEDMIMTFLRAREWAQNRTITMNIYFVGIVVGVVLLLFGHCFATTLSVAIGFYVSCWSSLRKYYNRILTSFVDAIKEYEHDYHPRASTDLDYFRYGTHLIQPGELVLVLGEFVQMSDPRNAFGFFRDVCRGCLAIAAVLYSYNIKCVFCGLMTGKVFYDQFQSTRLAIEMRTTIQPLPHGPKSELPVWMSMGQFFGCSALGVALCLFLGLNTLVLDAFISSFVGGFLCTLCALRLARMNGRLSVDVDISVGSNAFLLCFYTATLCGFLAQFGQLVAGFQAVVRGLVAPVTVLERLLLRLAVWSFSS